MENIKPASSKLNQETEIRLMGCDPSLTATGLAIISLKGIKETAVLKMKPVKKGQKDPRFNLIVEAVKAFLIAHQPDGLAIETQYINPRTIFGAMKTIEIKGAIQALFISYCLERGIEPMIFNVTPLEAKQTVGATGKFKNRKESKIIVRKRIIEKFPSMRNKTEDEMDAVAIGITGLVKLAANKI